MPTEEYNVVFYGEIADGHTVEKVSHNLTTMFGVPAELVEGAFEGTPLLVKDHVDYQTALQYKAVFERAGTVCKIEAFEPTPKQEIEASEQTYETESKKEQIVTFQNNELEIARPDGWMVEEVGEDADIVMTDPQTKGYFVVLSKPKSEFDKDIDYKQYSKLSRVHIKKHNKDYQEVSGPIDVDIHGMTGIQYEMTVVKEGDKLHYLHTMLDGERSFYQLIAVSPIATYNSHKPTFENILNSFRIKRLIAEEKVLFTAVKAGSLKTVQQLIEQGANVNAKEEDNGTPLHYAAMEGFLDIARVLIEKGADIHAKTTEDITPLHMAVMGYDIVERENLAIGQLLLENGADFNVSDAVGLTPLELARMKGPTEFVRILRQAGAT